MKTLARRVGVAASVMLATLVATEAANARGHASHAPVPIQPMTWFRVIESSAVIRTRSFADRFSVNTIAAVTNSRRQKQSGGSRRTRVASRWLDKGREGGSGTLRVIAVK